MSEKRVYLPLVTPLTEEGAVCRDSVARLVAFARPCVDALVPCLTSGEGWLLSPEQWETMLQCCVEHAEGLPVIAGLERPTTDEVIFLARKAARLGADGVICAAPFAAGTPRAAVHEHFERVHDATSLDLYVYYEFTLCQTRWDADTLAALCALPRVKGVKDSSGDNGLVPHLDEIRRLGVSVYQGWEDRLLEYDADGAMVSFANLDPCLCREVVRRRDASTSAALVEQCKTKGIFEPDWYRHVKRALCERGVIRSARTVPIGKDAEA